MNEGTQVQQEAAAVESMTRAIVGIPNVGDLDRSVEQVLNVVLKSARNVRSKEEVAALVERVLRNHHFQARVMG